MALSILRNPTDGDSVTSEVLFVLNESTKANDPVTYPNYKYVADIYVSSVLVARLKSVPDPTYKYGIFDVSHVLQGYVADYGLDVTNDDINDYTIKLDYQIKFGEEYSDTLYTNLLTDSSRYVFRTYKKRPFTSNSVIPNNDNANVFSNMPSTVNYHREQLYHLIPYYANVSGISNTTLTFKTEGGSTISTVSYSNATYEGEKVRQINIGEKHTNIPSNAAYAEITGLVSTIRVNYLCESKYDAHTLVWLNPYGAYDSQSFGGVSKKSIEVDRKSYGRLPYQVGSGGSVGYSSNGAFYGTKRGFATSVKSTLKLTSHLLTEAEYTWLSELFVSPDVYLFDTATAKFIPVTVKPNLYEFRNYQNSRLTALEFEVELSDDYNSQYL